jgi:hypothetical protein
MPFLCPGKRLSAGNQEKNQGDRDPSDILHSSQYTLGSRQIHSADLAHTCAKSEFVTEE